MSRICRSERELCSHDGNIARVTYVIRSYLYRIYAQLPRAKFYFISFILFNFYMYEFPRVKFSFRKIRFWQADGVALIEQHTSVNGT